MEEIHDDGSPTEKTFEHVPTEIGAEEAEEVELIFKQSYVFCTINSALKPYQFSYTGWCRASAEGRERHHSGNTQSKDHRTAHGTKGTQSKAAGYEGLFREGG